MGLDIGVFPFVEIPENIHTEDELNDWCEKTENEWCEPRASEAVPEKWLRKIRFKVLDKYEMFRRRGLDHTKYELYEFTKQYVIYEPVDSDSDDDYVQFQPNEFVYAYELIPVYAYGEEIGYQRKGANAAFYDDGLWGTNVFTKEMLLEHWDKYFSDPNNERYKKHTRSVFGNNIIKHFKEGETFVSYY